MVAVNLWPVEFIYRLTAHPSYTILVSHCYIRFVPVFKCLRSNYTNNPCNVTEWVVWFHYHIFYKLSSEFISIHSPYLKKLEIFFFWLQKSWKFFDLWLWNRFSFFLHVLVFWSPIWGKWVRIDALSALWFFIFCRFLPCTRGLKCSVVLHFCFLASHY